jgi:hypothetical protein
LPDGIVVAAATIVAQVIIVTANAVRSIVFFIASPSKRLTPKAPSLVRTALTPAPRRHLPVVGTYALSGSAAIHGFLLRND